MLKKVVNIKLLLIIVALSFISMGCLDAVGTKIIPDYTYGQKSDDAQLRFLKAKDCDLTPAFSPDTYSYTTEVVSSVETLDIVAIASDTASVAINGTTISGSLKTVSVPETTQDVTIEVTAEDGKNTQQYTVTVNKVMDPSEARLTSLTVSEGILAPVFDPDYGNYAVTVSSASGTLDVTPTAMNPNADITVDSVSTPSGDPYTVDVSGLPADGTSTQNINIEIVSDDGLVTENYIIVVTKSLEPVCDIGGTNADLASLEIIYGTSSTCRLYGFNGGTSNFIPGAVSFDKDTLTYAVVVYGYDTITVTATAEDTCVKALTIDGSGTVSDGVTTQSVSLTQGVTQDIVIEVTADDDSTTKTYTVKARLLNIYEFYYGIYGPVSRDNKAEWMAANTDPFPGDDFTFTGSISGTMHWVIEWIQFLSTVSNSMTFDNYNNGGQGYAYCEDAFALTGVMAAEVNTSGDGFQTGTVVIDSRWGDELATLNLHLELESKDVISSADSYTDITYMGETVRMMYIGTPTKESLDPSDWHPDTPWTS